MHRHVHISRINSDIGSCWGFWFTPTRVITTAHCVKGASRVSVSNEVGVYFGVNRIIMHSAYDEDNLKNDVAILSTMVINRSVQNNRITFARVTPTMYINSSKVTVTKCQVTSFAFDFCATHHECLFSLVCDKNCKGHSGLPVLTEKGEITGLVSGGPANCERNDAPGGYVSLYEHKTFMARAVQQHRVQTVQTSKAQKAEVFLVLVLVFLIFCL
jgi:secreted trypsin-like serine protease